jgi:REP element-mobilizing transposase RayT
MLELHANVYALPPGACEGPVVSLRELSLPTLRSESGGPPAFLATLPVTFEEMQAALFELERSDCEPDGFFLVTGHEGDKFWRLNGHMHEYEGQMHRVELHGECPAATLDDVLRAMGWPAAELVFELVKEGVTLREREFRAWADTNRIDTTRLANIDSSQSAEVDTRAPASRVVSTRSTHLTAWHITFGTYGARLHGDERPTVHRSRNQLGQAFEPEDMSRKFAQKSHLVGGAVQLFPEQSVFIEATLPTICERGGWMLHACAAGIDHVHVVVGVPEDVHGERVQQWMKRWLSEALNQKWPKEPHPRWWTKGGSNKAIKDEAYLKNAIAYVVRQRATPLD